MKSAAQRTILAILVLASYGGIGQASDPSDPSDTPPADISNLSLEGNIEGENVTFRLAFSAESRGWGGTVDLPLVEGEVAYLDSELPRGAKVKREGRRFVLELPRGRERNVAFAFASLASKQGDWRETRFSLPNASVRKIVMTCDREDLEIRFPGALRVEREAAGEGKGTVTAYLGVGNEFVVSWKPEVRQLTADLAVTCEANTLATASVGALRTDTLFTYRVVQGSLNQLAIALPEGINVTQVRGADILEWRIEDTAAGARDLVVVLNRARKDRYQLQVESELVLPEFPCRFDLPALAPRDVIRTSGFLLSGTDSAVKLVVNRAAGLTQIDQEAFPALALQGQGERTRPGRSLLAYQYANLPYRLALSADDIVTSFDGEEGLVLTLKDNDLLLNASVELDVRDAPAREMVIETSPDWVVANVTGANVADFDVRDEGGIRLLTLHFGEAVMGRVLFNVRLERSLDEGAEAFDVPPFRLRDARAERGYLVLAAETGKRLEPGASEGLREVQIASLPVKVGGAQQAFRFKNPEWSLALDVRVTRPAIYTELFHLVSLGEGTLYGSCSVTYHVEGAPVRDLVLRIPEDYRHVEFVGGTIRGWKQDGDTWTVSLQEKVLGDYTLLVTYDQEFDYAGGQILVGGVETVGADTETGYIAVAGAANLNVEDAGSRSAALMPIEQGEIPEAYGLLISDPLLKAFKYVRRPHTARLAVSRYPTQQLLSKVTDHTTLSTRISEEGEEVTTVRYYVKNTSDQHLAVTLPEGARLWRVEVDGREVQALQDGQAGARVLIPIERHPDPNQPSRVELTYARSHQELGLRQRVNLFAPMPLAQSVFARWTVTAPARYALALAGGNMMSEGIAPRSGFRQLFGTVLYLYVGALKQAMAWVPALCLVVFAACLVAFNRASPRGFAVSVTLALLLCALAGLLLVQHAGDMAGLLDKALGVIVPPAGEVQQSFAKVVSAEDSGLDLQVNVVNAWLGTESSVLKWGLGVGAGAVLVVLLRRRPVLLAAGLTVFCWGLSQAAVTLGGLAVVLALLFPVVLVVRLVRWCGARGRRWMPVRPPEPDTPASEPPSSLPPEFGTAAGGGTEGSVGLPAAVALLVAGLTAWACAAGAAEVVQALNAQQGEPAPAAPEMVLDKVTLDIEGPDTGEGSEWIARISGVATFEGEKGDRFILLRSPLVLVECQPGSRHLKLRPHPDGAEVEVLRKGEYEIRYQYLARVTGGDGGWSLGLDVPASLRNDVTFSLPAAGLEVYSDDAVLLTASETGGVTRARAVFKPARCVTLAWKPQVRRTRLEEAVFFCDVNSLAVFESGVVNLRHAVRYRIAQGEVQSFKMEIPEGMSVTSVRAPGLSTWRYDPDARLMEAVLDKPVTGDFLINVTTQVPREGLPYEVDLALPVVPDAERQRGALAMAVPDTVQIRVADPEGLNSMNIGDFPPEQVAEAQAAHRGGRRTEVKRAYRYHQLPVRATVQAEQVLPEVRVMERASVDISDERIVLSSQLRVSIARSGLFQVRLDIPEGYDVESLTGQDVSHWDELEEGEHQVVVHFLKQVLGERTLNVVLVRPQRGLEAEVAVPRISVQDAAKHTGSLVVSGEHGVRFTTLSREAVSEVNPVTLGIEGPGYLAFSLLRPEWRVVLQTEQMEPVVKAEVLQRVDLAEGLLQGRCYIRYTIDNAGVKTFLLQSPAAGLPLNISGRDVAQVQEIDTEQGIWQVELRSKVENNYLLEASYQVSFDTAAQDVDIRPLQTLETQGQKGYLVVFSGGRLQVQPTQVARGLHAEDARNIPGDFRAEGLSDAILCYRATRLDYSLRVEVVRHDAADVLPATVDQVRLTSVVSQEGEMATRVALTMQVGDLHFLRTALPEESDIWSVFVAGQPVVPLMEEGELLIPLEKANGSGTADVELIYGGHASFTRLFRRQLCQGPRFDLPLTDIEWSFYLPRQYRYHGFDGTLQHRKTGMRRMIARFDARRYEDLAQQEVAGNLYKAEQVLKRGEEFARQGRQEDAKKAFEAAMYYSQGEASFNEDARIQYRNLARQQAVVGLVNRRDNLKVSNALQDADELAQLKGFQDGNWTQAYGDQVQQSLTSTDNLGLNTVAERILDQQAAAAGVSPAIRVTMPEHGKRIDFVRALQIHPLSEMRVEFKVSSGRMVQRIASAVLALLLVGIFLLLVGGLRTKTAVA